MSTHNIYFLHKNLCCGCSLESLCSWCSSEAILMSTHNIVFYEDLTKIIFQLSPNTSKYAHYLSRVMRKPDFCICKKKDADQLRGNPEADQRFFVLATRIVLSLYFLNPKFQVSSLMNFSERACSSVCVGPSRKSRRPVFSRRGSSLLLL